MSKSYWIAYMFVVTVLHFAVPVTSLLKQGWNEVPELVAMITIATASVPFGLYAAYKIHHRTWTYKRKYVVYRDDDPEVPALREAYKNFVPYEVPK